MLHYLHTDDLGLIADGRVVSWSSRLSHTSQSLTFLSKSVIGRFVRVAMLFIQVIRCSPLPRDPGNVPCMISCSRLVPCFFCNSIISGIVLWRAALLSPLLSPKLIHLFSFPSTRRARSCTVPSFRMHLVDLPIVFLHCPTSASVSCYTCQMRDFSNLIYVPVEMP